MSMANDLLAKYCPNVRNGADWEGGAGGENCAGSIFSKLMNFSCKARWRKKNIQPTTPNDADGTTIAIPEMDTRKRRRPGREAGPPEPSYKRVKIVHESPTFEAIHSAGQLKQLLAFDQDSRKTRHGEFASHGIWSHRVDSILF
jgi:hypothetical protein